jgi:hypothetical protein
MLTLLMFSFAHAFQIELMGGGSSFSPSFSGRRYDERSTFACAAVWPSTCSTSSGSELTFGSNAGISILGGVNFIFQASEEFDIEVGLQYFGRKNTFLRSSGDDYYSLASKHLALPVLFRFRVLPNIGLGIGAWYAQGIGSMQYTQQSAFTALSQSRDVSFNDAGRSKADFGAVASVDMIFPITESMQLGADLRYLFGLKNNDTSGQGDLKTRDLQFMAKLRFDFPEEAVDKSERIFKRPAAVPVTQKKPAPKRPE